MLIQIWDFELIVTQDLIVYRFCIWMNYKYEILLDKIGLKGFPLVLVNFLETNWQKLA